MKLYNVALALGLAGLGILQQANSVKALTWDWSYTIQNGTIATGTFTTAGTTPQANTPYTITGIGGLRGGVQITGLSNSQTIFETPDNTFEWNGSTSSPILLNGNGIGYNTANSSYILSTTAIPDPLAYFPIDQEGSISTGSLTGVSSSTLTPETALVPEPDEILGTLAFGAIGAGYLRHRQFKKAAV